MPTATGDMAAMRPATASARPTVSAAGTTSIARPQAQAVAASIALPVIIIHIARVLPTMRGTRWVPLSPEGGDPHSGKPKRAVAGDHDVAQRRQFAAAAQRSIRSRPRSAALGSARWSSLRAQPVGRPHIDAAVRHL
jgi:hypothetical protein